MANHSKLEKSRLPHFMLGRKIIVGAPDEVEINDALTSVFGLEEREGREALVLSSATPAQPVSQPVSAAPVFKQSPVLAKAPVSSEPVSGQTSLHAPIHGFIGGTSAELLFAEEEIDLGSIPAGEAVPVTVKLSNPGKSRLLITGTARLSGCRVISELPISVPPGADGEISLELTAPAQSGPFARKLKLTSNISGNPSSLTLAANVLR